jgi:hypothetical protein
MFALVLLWMSNISQLLVLWRAVRASAIKKYPYFYAYVGSTCSSFILSIVYLADRSSYNRWYWPIQLVTLVFGCGVVIEIFRHVLSPYPGAEKFAMAAAFAAFGAVFCVAIFYMVFGIQPFSVTAAIDLERNVRAVQAALLFAILAVVFHYRIPIGRNIRGMIVGYGIYIAISLISRAVEAFAGGWLRLVWLYVQPLSFEGSLVIWLVALWSYQPNPAPDALIQIEADYEALASRTRTALRTMRSYLGRASHS